jgi:hypothetical protein
MLFLLSHIAQQKADVPRSKCRLSFPLACPIQSPNICRVFRGGLMLKAISTSPQRNLA